MDATADVQWREVSATGRYDESQQVLVRNRTYNGIPGYFVLTPLEVPSGDVVIVNRGFVPLETSGTKPKVPAAPSGVVAVNGRVRSTQKRGLLRSSRSRRRHAHRGRSGGPRAAAAADAVPPAPRLHRARDVRPVRCSRHHAGALARARRRSPPELRDPVVPLLGPGRRRLGARRAQDREGRRQDHRRRETEGDDRAPTVVGADDTAP